MRTNPHQVTADFERELCSYTGSKFAVCTNSCTMAILLALAWHIPPRCRLIDRDKRPRVSMPKTGYFSVAQSIVHAGGWPVFRDEEWSGAYQLSPFPVWDSARRFTSSMYVKGQFQCVSFHASKILGLEQGGAILHDDEEADSWLRRSRMDGRTPGADPATDDYNAIAWRCYMNPSTAAQGILKLWSMPAQNDDIPNLYDWPKDLSKLEVYRG